MRTLFPIYLVIEHSSTDEQEAINDRIRALLDNGSIKDAVWDAGLELVSLGTTGEYETLDTESF